jgi:hypothetical protein
MPNVFSIFKLVKTRNFLMLIKMTALMLLQVLDTNQKVYLFFSIDPSVVNISDEMAKTAQWKALSMNTENAKVTRPNTR